jgi:hypothetical protein
VAALQRLVNASIAALKNAANSDNSNGSNSMKANISTTSTRDFQSLSLPDGAPAAPNSYNSSYSSKAINSSTATQFQNPSRAAPDIPPVLSSNTMNMMKNLNLRSSTTSGYVSGNSIPISNINGGATTNQYLNSGSNTNTSSWGEKDNYYSAGDVYKKS